MRIEGAPAQQFVNVTAYFCSDCEVLQNESECWHCGKEVTETYRKFHSAHLMQTVSQRAADMVYE